MRGSEGGDGSVPHHPHPSFHLDGHLFMFQHTLTFLQPYPPLSMWLPNQFSSQFSLPRYDLFYENNDNFISPTSTYWHHQNWMNRIPEIISSSHSMCKYFSAYCDKSGLMDTELIHGSTLVFSHWFSTMMNYNDFLSSMRQEHILWILFISQLISDTGGGRRGVSPV